MSPRALPKILFYYGGLILYFALTDPGTANMFQDFLTIIPDAQSYFYTRPVVVVICWIMTVWGIGLILNTQSQWVRRVAWVVFWIASTLSWMSYEVTDAPFNIYQYELVLSEYDSAASFASAYFGFLLPAFLKISAANILLALLIYALKPPRFHSYKLLFLLAFIAAVVNTVRYKAVTPGIPSFFAVPASVIYKHASRQYYGPRDTLTVIPTAPAEVDTIILIVDETVRDDFLSINNPKIETTPYLTTVPLINYGTGIAIANSSRHSNTAIRTGLTPEQIPDKNFLAFKKPNIFQFAKNAGFKTSYANAQKTGKTLDNLMNKFDLPFIDTFQNVGPGIDNKHCGDEPIADFILRHTQSGEKNFIYVNKVGNHFPYAQQYPAAEEIFTPAHKPGETQSDYVKTVNAYKNSMRWTVDKFFAYLLPKLEGKKYLIVYVSDHGEAISESHRASGHASVLSASPDEVRVGFFALTDQKNIGEMLQKHLKYKYNQATQFDIFPTLLWAFGYTKEWVRETFGPSLIDREAYPRKFFIGSIQHSGHWADFTI